MTSGGTRPLLWPLLLLLLPLTPEATLTRPPSELRPSTSPLPVKWRNPGALEDWEAMAGTPRGSLSRPHDRLREDINRVCGKPKGIGKVFGGQNAVAGQWPWQASLLFRERHLCGAALLDAHWLVSAAHCFLNKSQSPQDYTVLLGNNQLYQQTSHTQKLPVRQIITHKAFEKFHPYGSDIAMVQLKRPVNFTSYVVPVCLPSTDVQLSHQSSCWITGWGKLSEDTKLLQPFLLQEGKVGLVENKFCNTLFRQRSGHDNDYVHEEMLCVGDFSTGKSICPVDSGGPLVCFHSNVWVLVGLASWGLDCRHPVYPSVFTRVSYFTEWIYKVKRLMVFRHNLSIQPHMNFSAVMRPTDSAESRSTLVSAQTWLLLPFSFIVPQQALW
ncbi:putative serine protease 47 [Perognathus longimembris pacificus]|uniref:putative serine protease 47 n=1 Tax=Perognathus longimembris pacificus TaxID=214514 RepID=UPI002018FCF8|nr:putative serine protease 47 [Perognathus longimembris pacificus]